MTSKTEYGHGTEPMVKPGAFSRHSTKQGLDLWTCGLVDSFFIYFNEMQKRSTGYDFTFNMYHAALPRLTRKKDLVYFLSVVLYNIYSLRINQRQGVSVVDTLDYSLLIGFQVT